MTNPAHVYCSGDYSSRSTYHCMVLAFSISFSIFLTAVIANSVLEFSDFGDWRQLVVASVIAAIQVILTRTTLGMSIAYIKGAVERQVLDSNGAFFVMAGIRYSIPWRSVKAIYLSKRKFSNRFDIAIAYGVGRIVTTPLVFRTDEGFSEEVAYSVLHTIRSRHRI